MGDDDKPAGGGLTMQVDAVEDAAELLGALNFEAAGGTEVPDSLAPPAMAPPPLPPKKKNTPMLVLGVVVAVLAAGLGLWVGGAVMGPAPQASAPEPEPTTETSTATEATEVALPIIELGAIEVEASHQAATPDAP